jgi:hypothetical protein
MQRHSAICRARFPASGALARSPKNFIQQCGTADTPANRQALEVATFAIRQLGELIELLKANYDKRWHNEPVQ